MESAFEGAKQRDTVPFRHDIVGSFLRPAALKEARAKFQAGEITANDLRKVEDEEITKLVQKQKEVGLKGVTDGEFRRSWWHLDFFWGLDGVEKRVAEQGYVFHGVVTRAETAILTGKIGCSVHPMVEHFKFLKQVAGEGVTPRMNIPGPAQFLYEIQRDENKKGTEEIYPNFEDLLTDIASAYNTAIRSFYDAGCRNLQIDDCTWGIIGDPKIQEAYKNKGIDVNELFKVNVDITNRAIVGLPEDLVLTMHVCRGNYKSTYLSSGGYDPVEKYLFSNVNVKGLYLEFDTERAGTFEPLRFVGDKQIVVGLFSSKFGKLEDKEQIKARVVEATKVLNINQICLSTQCGFASTEEGNILTEEGQWNKLRHIKEVADEIWH